ncbi:hypothetical protein A2755_02620 [Candidatus Wolfebacteria bacterium RIFCSPHIGHO2_01_FULL_48_22]|uniref:Uncharacterized protein n=2 Tax=Candidatus Wolfeibacteriota TaxID=1752735 RepID=A0A1F8DRK1_9BACT|nr:MAG: hypothetical protein A2755_02620 [Candidatus Wolfebacteria bacterium RIFCSPHIGHO2_01_FULL_48_22]OGM92233.1 MAG: hypothetical protein A2935_00445 [Candidatus Wolfebacteria bacterium RIFCSPLOWO2_01_FULL_47_17b]
MTHKIVYILIFVIVLAAVWFWLDSTQTTNPAIFDEGGLPLSSPSPQISPSPAVSASPDSLQGLEQELDASVQGDIDAEFESVDNDINSL